jgi:hypothetical protein
MSDLSPWLILIALGAFHGLNPAMGWFFAASLVRSDAVPFLCRAPYIRFIPSTIERR